MSKTSLTQLFKNTVQNVLKSVTNNTTIALGSISVCAILLTGVAAFQVSGVLPELLSNKIAEAYTPIDSCNLNVTINQAASQPDPTSLQSINYTVVFSAPIDVASFTTSDVVLTGTAPGKSVTSVTQISPNDGTTFEVNAFSNGSGTILANIPEATYTYTSSTLGNTGPNPVAITVDAAGNIYTANANSNNVSKITPTGVSSILGITDGSPVDITIDAAGNIYTGNRNSNNVSKITPTGVSSILGTTGYRVESITVDAAGNIYTANANSNNVSKITPAGVSSILGTTGFDPVDITIDAAGNIYTANTSSNNVSKITPTGVSSILGITGGSPNSITVDAAGNIYTGNRGSNNVSKITPTGVSSILGNVGNYVNGITIDAAGNIYTVNYLSDNVTKLTKTFISGVKTSFGCGNSAGTFADNLVTIPQRTCTVQSTATDNFDDPAYLQGLSDRNVGTSLGNGWYSQNGGIIGAHNGNNNNLGADIAQSGSQYLDMFLTQDYPIKQFTITSAGIVDASMWFSNRFRAGPTYIPWTGKIDILDSAFNVVASGNQIPFVESTDRNTWFDSSISNFLLSTPGTYYLRGFVGDDGSFDTASFCITDLAILNVKVNLAASFNNSTDQMSTALESNNLRPINQPFNVAPWNYTGTESYSRGTSISDWVLVEIRNSVTNALITRKATLVDPGGNVLPLILPGVTSTGNYKIIVRSRNHIAIATNTPVQLTLGGTTNIDFTSNVNVKSNNQIQVGTVGTGNTGAAIYGLRLGDSNSDGSIDALDRSFISSSPEFDGVYDTKDVNLDGAVDAFDRSLSQNALEASEVL